MVLHKFKCVDGRDPFVSKEITGEIGVMYCHSKNKKRFKKFSVAAFTTNVCSVYCPYVAIIES